jgi:hypothetical protein
MVCFAQNLKNMINKRSFYYRFPLHDEYVPLDGILSIRYGRYFILTILTLGMLFII